MPKLTLRDQLAVVTIVAVALASLVDHRKMAATQSRLRGEVLILKQQLELVQGVTKGGGSNVKIDNEAGTMTVTYAGTKTVTRPIVTLRDQTNYSLSWRQSVVSYYDALMPEHIFTHLLLVVIIVSLALGWRLDRVRLARSNRELVAATST